MPLQEFTHRYLMNPMVIEITIITTLTLILAFIARRLVKAVGTSKLPHWIKKLFESIKNIVPNTVLGLGFFFVVESILNHLGFNGPLSKVAQGRYIFLIFMILLLIQKWRIAFTNYWLKKIKGQEKSALDANIVQGLSKIGSIIISVITGLICLDVIGIPISALYAFGGVGGIAVSWAAKDVIANFFGGFMIYINHPFQVGDWIRSPNKSFEGVVEDIGWYRTQIRTFERRPTYIPNALITDAIVENPGRMYNRRIRTTIGLRYQDIKKVEPIVEGIRQMLKNHPAIDQKQITLVHFLSYNAYSLDIEIYTFTKTTNWAEYRNQQQDVLLKVAEIVEAHDAEFAFPTQDINVFRPASSPTIPQETI